MDQRGRRLPPLLLQHQTNRESKLKCDECCRASPRRKLCSPNKNMKTPIIKQQHLSGCLHECISFGEDELTVHKCMLTPRTPLHEQREGSTSLCVCAHCRCLLHESDRNAVISVSEKVFSGGRRLSFEAF